MGKTFAKLMLLVALMCVPVAAQAYTCEQVRWAVRTLPKKLIKQYERQATPEQIEAARKCLREKS